MSSGFSTTFVTNDAFKKYWHTSTIWTGYSAFFSLITALYLLQKFITLPKAKLHDEVVLARYIISSLLLIALPFVNSNRFKYFFVTGTSIVLLACIINLEGIFERRQSFISLYIMSIFYRTTRYHTFFDNFALCIAYSADVASITHRNLNWYVSSNLAIWTYFFIALLFNNLYKRNSLRVWEYIRLLIILKEKTKKEQISGESLVSAHLPPDILEYIFPLKQPGGGVGGPEENNNAANNKVQQDLLTDASQRAAPVVPNNPASSEFPPVEEPTYSDNITNKFLQSTVNNGIILEFNPGNVSPNQLKSISRVDKKSTVLVAARVDKGNAKDCALAVDREHKVHQMLDSVAVKYNITSIRRFGNTWIGTVGYFKTFADDNINCYKTILFCCEMDYIAKSMGMKLAFAIDFGTIVGGFVTSFQFDIFGQEIRWLLRMIDLNDFGRIIISDSVRQQLNVYKRANPQDSMVLFEKRSIDINGKRHLLTSVMNPQDLVKPKEIGQQFHLPESEGPDDFSEHLVDGIWKITFDPTNDKRVHTARKRCNNPSNSKANSSNNNASTNKPSPVAQSDYFNNPVTEQQKENVFIRIGELMSILDPEYWSEDVGGDFQLSTMEKFGICLDDPVLSKYTSEDLDEAHKLLEADIYRLIKEIFFSNICNVLSMISIHNIMQDKDNSSVKTSSSGTATDAAYESPLKLYRSKKWMMNAFYELQSIVVSSMWYSFFVKSKLGTMIVGKTKYNTVVVDDDEEKELKALHTDKFDKTMSTFLETTTFSDGGDFTSSTTSDTDHEDLPRQVSWSEYFMNAKMLFHNTLLNFLFESFLFLTCWYAIQPAVTDSNSDSASATFVNLIIVHFILCQTLERISQRYGGLILLVVHAIIFFCMPCSLWRELSNSNDSQFGDFGGDVMLLLVFTFRIPSHIHQSGFLVVFDILFSRMILLARSLLTNGTCSIPTSGRLSTGLVYFILAAYYLSVEHRIFVAFLLEHKLIPYALNEYNKQKANTKELLYTFSPQLPLESEESRGSLKWYRNSVIAAVHIKACDIISGLVEARDVAKLVKVIGTIIDKSFQEFGMLKVTNFSGVYIAMICRSMGKEGWDRSGASSPYATHVLFLLRTIQARIEKFSKDHNFNVALGISLNHGSAYVGFLGNSQYCFDVAGPTRDMAVAMASHNGEGIFASRVFEADIHRIMPSDDLVHHQKIPDESNPDSYWLMVDGNFSGMQLDDFTYTGMLGRGGYGSVHLVCEKSTNTQYAVKAIALRQGSVMSKMIKRECIILQKMKHPNVVNLKYSFISNNRLYLVMSFIRGGNLKQVIERAPVEFPQLRYWFAELVLAIEYVHSVGIIHRDIKPANCMIGTDGHLKLGDFGLSKTIASTKEAVCAAKNTVDALGVSDEVYHKLQNFLPLKSHIVNGGMQGGVRKVTSLVVKSSLSITNPRKQLNFSNFQIEVICAKNRNEAESALSKNNIDAIFIEVSENHDESVFLETIQLIQHFCSSLFNTIPVYLLSTPPDYRPMFMESGAKDCFHAAIEDLDEENFRRIFSIQAYVPNHTVATNSSQPVSSANNSSLGNDLSMRSNNINTPLVHNTTDTFYRSDISNAQGTGTTETRDTVVPTRGGVARTDHSIKNENTFVHSKSADQDHIVGTIHFIAPEVIKVRKYGKAVDWWACGVTFYVCITKQHLFKGDDKETVFENILSKNVDLSALAPHGEAIMNLVSGFACHDVSQRFGSQGTEVIKQHPFFESIDWGTVSTNPDLNNYRPGQFFTKFELKDKLQFYGETENREKKNASSNLREMEQRNINSLRRYNLNRERLRNAKKKKKSSTGRPFHIGHRIKLLVSGQVSPEKKVRRYGNSNSMGNSNSNSRSEASLSNGGESDSMFFSYETVLEEDHENSDDLEQDDMELSMAGGNNSEVLNKSSQIHYDTDMDNMDKSNNNNKTWKAAERKLTRVELLKDSNTFSNVERSTEDEVEKVVMEEMNSIAEDEDN